MNRLRVALSISIVWLGCATASASSAWVLSPVNGHQYKLTSRSLTWDQTEAEAVTWGGHLATVRNADEQAWLQTTFTQQHLWIGLYQLPDSVEPDGGWVWVSGDPSIYRNWDTDQPNNYLGDESRCEMNYPTSGRWNDSGAAYSHYGIMEVENTWPIAVDDHFTVAEDSSATSLDVMVNDSDADEGDTFTITERTVPSHGTATIPAGGKAINYKPYADFWGDDTFTYTITDNHGGTATATVTITITNVNDDPTANDDTVLIALANGQSMPIVIDVLANDTYLPDPPEILSVTSVGSAAHGTVILESGIVRYKPEATYAGPDSFSYTISDGNGGSDPATAWLRIDRFVPEMTGDVNGDGCCNVADLLIVRNRLGQGSCR